MSPLTVKRVYWYSDWFRNVRWAARELWQAAFGCQHDISTVRYVTIGEAHGLREGEWATIHVNLCRKCGRQFPFVRWTGIR